MNMIDKDAVLHMIDINTEPHAHGEWDSGYNVALSEMREKIKQIPTIEAEPDNGWISVKDRLPENDGKYMVWYKGEEDICEFDTDSQTFGYTYDDYDEMYSHLVCWDDGMNKDVTHWQPLPEPPKGE